MYSHNGDIIEIEILNKGVFWFEQSMKNKHSLNIRKGNEIPYISKMWWNSDLYSVNTTQEIPICCCFC